MKFQYTEVQQGTAKYRFLEFEPPTDHHKSAEIATVPALFICFGGALGVLCSQKRKKGPGELPQSL